MARRKRKRPRAAGTAGAENQGLTPSCRKRKVSPAAAERQGEIMSIALSNEQIHRMAPSVFAETPWQGVSDRYAFVPTSEVVGLLRKEGYAPVRAFESRTRIEEKRGFTKHTLRFRHQDYFLDRALTHDDLGTLIPEIVVTNSHDTGSAFKVDLGIFRLVCTNGMVVSDGLCESVSIRHSGRVDEVIDAAFEVIGSAPLAIESAQEMRAMELSQAEQVAFATAARELRWATEEHAPVRIAPESILRARRYDDKGADLWTTLNRTQENIIKGGVLVRGVGGAQRRAPAVKSVDGDRKLNKALWTLAEEMRKLKTA